MKSTEKNNALNPTPSHLLRAMIIRLAAVFIIIGALIFVPAGSFDYRNGWVFMISFFTPMCGFSICLFRNHRSLPEKRLKTRAIEQQRQWYAKVSLVWFVIAFLLPGFDYRFGWREMTAEVAAAYHSLMPEEQRVAAIYTQNYGEAGAIDFFGPAYGLPNAISGHNSYWEWGLCGYSGEMFIVIGGDEDDHREVYESATRVATHTNPYAMRYETDIPIFVCRRPKIPPKDIWNDVRRFI